VRTLLLVTEQNRFTQIFGCLLLALGTIFFQESE
jgi:hypothetical protein